MGPSLLQLIVLMNKRVLQKLRKSPSKNGMTYSGISITISMTNSKNGMEEYYEGGERRALWIGVR